MAAYPHVYGGPPTKASPAPVRYRLGSLDLFVLSDGAAWFDAGAAFGLVPRTMWEPYLVGLLDDRHRFRAGLNSVLLRSQGRTILIETGVGDKGPDGDTGLLRPALARIGVGPDDVDIVINTHLHYDHCGGNTLRRPDGTVAPAFPNARYLIPRGEWEVAAHPNERTRATYLAENFAPLADAGRLELFDGELAVTGGVRIVGLPGHTADHAGVVISSGRERAVYIGDMSQRPVHMERLAWIAAFDVLPLVSLDTKRRLVAEAVEGRHLIFTAHHPFPGVGMIEQQGRLRRWIEVAPDEDPAVAGPAGE